MKPHAQTHPSSYLLFAAEYSVLLYPFPSDVAVLLCPLIREMHNDEMGGKPIIVALERNFERS